MNDWTKIKTNRTLFILAVCSFVVTTAEGLLYYASYEDVLFRVLMTLQNTIQAFAFKTSISLEKARTFMLEDQTPLKTILGYAYMATVFIAPYCTIAALYNLLERALRLGAWIKRTDKKDRFLVFGYNNMTRRLLKDLDKRERVHIVSSTEIPSEDRYRLLTNKIQVHTIDLVQAKEKEIAGVFRDIELEKAKKVLLFEEDSVRNFSLLQTLGDVEKSGMRPGTKIFCRCEDEGIQRLIEGYYDAKTPDGKRQHAFDLELFDLYELQAREMYYKYPLHSYWCEERQAKDDKGRPKKELIPQEAPEKWRVHLLILGFGKLGQQALLQAMNLGVAHTENEIWIDVVDEGVEEKKNLFLNRFAMGTLETDGEKKSNVYRVNPKMTDGKLTIRFRQTDIRYSAFRNVLRELTEAPAGGFTYVISAIDQLDVGVHCAAELSRFLQKADKENGKRVPILLRMDSDHRLQEYIEKNGSGARLDGVRVIPNADSILTFEKVFGAKWDEPAKQCNAYYANMTFDTARSNEASSLQKVDLSKPEKAWQDLPLFKRNSNRAAAYHNCVLSDVLKAEYAGEDTRMLMDKVFTGESALIRRQNDVWLAFAGDDTLLEKVDSSRKALAPEYAFALEMLKTEHRRWCYYMISVGWEPPEENGKDAKTDEKLCVNPCLVPWDRLTEIKPDKCKYDLMPLMAECEQRKREEQSNGLEQ